MPSPKFLNPQYNLDFTDLYQFAGILKIQQIFLNFLNQNHRDFFANYTIENSDNSAYLIELAKILEEFLIDLFVATKDNEALKIRDEKFKIICQARKDYIQRFIAKQYSVENLSIINDFNHLDFLKNNNLLNLKIAEIEFEISKKIFAQPQDESLQKYCVWALFKCEGQDFHKDGTLFILPQKIDKFALITAPKKRLREGFNLTDDGYSALRASGEANYCLYCHRQNKDSCKTGLINKDNNRIKIDELGIELDGCPLDQKISEMNLLKSQGFSLAGLAMAIIDNPMIALTGHRICNDCMKSCIFQKQDAVDIPQIESRILKDVLALPYGFEIYSLLTRWNPLNIKNPHLKPFNHKKILVCGLGPSGLTLSHYLLNEGYEVVAIDGLKIEPLAPKISGVDSYHQRHEFIPIANVNEIYEDLSTRIIGGFGGVAEYGITVRFNKNYLKIIRLLLERRQNFAMYGGIRFGSSITDKIAFEDYGFDHVALCVGAGQPQFIDMANNFAKGVRLAADFLMALQLTGAFQEKLFTNLQIRLPIVVIGGGLTAVDAACEALAYYKVQIKKFAEKWRKFGENKIADKFLAMLSDEEKNIAQEFLQDANNLGDDSRFKAQILYRKKITAAPAYRLNHQELQKALEEGVEFIDEVVIDKIIIDEFDHVCAIETVDKRLFECRTLIMAVGSVPNLSFVKADNLEFANDGKYLSAINIADEISEDEYEIAELKNSPRQKHLSFIAKIDPKTYKAVSFFGDMHPNFEGNVVKAMASAKKGYQQINNILQLREKKLANNKIFSETNRTYQNYQEDFLVNMMSVKRLSKHVVEVNVKSKLLANQTQIGQIFRLHNYHALANFKDQQILAMEGVVVTALAVNKGNGVITGIVVETGGSTSLIQNFLPMEPCVFMGPSGKPTEIPTNETVVLIGGGRGNQPLCALAKLFKNNGCRVIFFAGYRQSQYIVNHELMKNNSDELIISVENNHNSEANFFAGNVVDALIDYFKNSHEKIDRVFVIGNDELMDQVAQLRTQNIIKEFAEAKYAISSLNAPMQCMLKGVCGQCLQKRILKNGKVEYYYACASQDQPSDEVDFQHLHNRCKQNSLLEKMAKIWIENLLR